MSEQQQNTPKNKPNVGKTKPKKTNKAEKDAEKLFNDNSSPMSASQFFREWQKDVYVDTYVVQEDTLIERLSEDDCATAKEVGRYEFNQVDANVDFQCETFAMDGLALARKMLTAVPESEEYELGRFRDLTKAELHAPANFLAAIHHVGKYTKDDRVVRIRYNSQDVIRILLKVLRRMSHHSQFNNILNPPFPNETWQTLRIDRVILNSESSVLWILDQSGVLLQTAFARDWIVPVTVPGVPDPVEMHVSYPSLPVPFGSRLTVPQFLGWAANLNQHMPHIDELMAAAASACWEKRWFDFIDTPFQDFLPGLVPAWFGVRTPGDLLRTLGYKYLNLEANPLGIDGYFTLPEQVRVITSHVLAQRIKFNRIFNLVRQDNNMFGTSAQTIIYQQQQLVLRESRAFPGDQFYVPRTTESVKAIHENKDKGDTAAGLIFAFSTSMTEVMSYSARASMDPNMARRQYLSGDVRNDRR